MITDGSGQVIARRDFMPFGEELGAGVGQRTESLKYSYAGSDNIKKRFTGYEKDDETGLDFAEARMYQNRHGRFTAVDPLLASVSLTNPQTFNRYSYTSNNPVNYNDPSGLAWCRTGSGSTSFVGQNTACSEKDGEDVTNSVVTITGGDWSKEKAKVGDTVILNPNGTVTVNNSTEARAIAQGQSVVSATVEVSGQTATEAVSSAAVTTGSPALGGTMSPRPMLSLGCPPSLPCGSGSVPLPSLVEGASAKEVLDTVQFFLDGIGTVPGIGEPFDAASGIISLGRGDYTGAALSAGAVIPFLGDAAGVAKIARRLHQVEEGVEVASDVAKAVHGNSKLSTAAQHGYEVFETARGAVVKTGVSGGPVTKAGKSYRASNQVSKLNKSVPGLYDSRIVKNIPAGSGARDQILKFEIENAARHRGTLDRNIHRRP